MVSGAWMLTVDSSSLFPGVSAHVTAEVRGGVGRQPLSSSFHHMTTLHASLLPFLFFLSLPPALSSLLLICLSLPFFFLAFMGIIFSHSEGFLVLILAWLRFSQTLVQFFWLLGAPDNPYYRWGWQRTCSLSFCTPAGDLRGLGSSPAPAWRKPVLFRSQGLYIESALKVLKGRTVFESVCIWKTLTGFVNLKKYCSVCGAMFW